MYVGIDIGGTKTLIAVFDENGKVQESVKFPTPVEYSQFVAELANTVANLATQDFAAAAVAIPGILDRNKGLLVKLGNLPWENEQIQADIEKITHCPVFIENDAKLAGLSEALLVSEQYNRVLYVTVSTGIGIGLIIDGVIDNAVGDTGGHDMYLEYRGKQITWEQLASGKAIVEKYGMRASELNDPKAWKEISNRIAVGLIELIAIFQPEAIIIGGGVGTHFHKFGHILDEQLKTYELPMITMPKLLQAQKPEEAVTYGCYRLIQQKLTTR